MSKETIETLASELTHEEDWRRMRATAACVAGGPQSVQAWMDALRTDPTELKKEAAAMSVWTNCYNIFDAALPLGGYKQSGWGREMGHDALPSLEHHGMVT